MNYSLNPANGANGANGLCAAALISLLARKPPTSRMLIRANHEWGQVTVRQIRARKPFVGSKTKVRDKCSRRRPEPHQKLARATATAWGYKRHQLAPPGKPQILAQNHKAPAATRPPSMAHLYSSAVCMFICMWSFIIGTGNLQLCDSSSSSAEWNQKRFVGGPLQGSAWRRSSGLLRAYRPRRALSTWSLLWLFLSFFLNALLHAYLLLKWQVPF